MNPIVLGPGEGESMTIAGNTIMFEADSGETGGALGVLDYTAAPGFPGPPPHLHREAAEVFFVLEGELTMRLGLLSPCGFEQYFRDLRDALAGVPLDPAAIREISARYDIENAG
jgi:hypothetical protein